MAGNNTEEEEEDGAVKTCNLYENANHFYYHITMMVQLICIKMDHTCFTIASFFLLV